MSREREVSPEEVRHMAKLSRLVIAPGEEAVFARQFGQILGHMAILESVDTTGIEPLYSPLGTLCATRADDADNLRSRTEILANAPQTDGHYFIVPRIV